MDKKARFEVGQEVFLDGERKTIGDVDFWQSRGEYYYHLVEDPSTVWVEEHALEGSCQSYLDSVNLSSPNLVAISISEDGRTVWVHVDGTLRFRASKVSSVEIEDSRKKENPNGKREGKAAVLRSKGPSIVKTRVRSRAPKNVS